LRGWSKALPAKPSKAVGDTDVVRLRELMDAAYPGWEAPPV
jgi:hypothetical protein